MGSCSSGLFFSQEFKLGFGRVITHKPTDQEQDEERNSEQEPHGE